MGLAKLQILCEKKGTKLQFDKDNYIEALFNPKQLAFTRSVGWKSASAKGRDVPELEFTTAEPRSLTIELLFDTYDTASQDKDDVREIYTEQLLQLTMVDSERHRPPICRLRWGSPGYFFQGVLEKLDQRFTMFLEDGTPVRASVSCTFKEWRTNYDDLNLQDLHSADVAKRWLLKRGDSLSGIAAQEYMDPSLWRPIAEKNHVDDPLDLTPGRVLKIPALSPEEQSRKGGPRS